MKKSLKKLFVFMIIGMLTIFCNNSLRVYATQLPPDVKEYIFASYPNAVIRFDGLINLPDGTFYLPLLPTTPTTKEKIKLKYTYPKNLKMAQKPEIIVFDNGYCLLKLIRAKNILTVTQLQNLPLEVRTGILPQDLLVPRGLVLPETLVSVLGDLSVPLKSNIEISKASLNTKTPDKSKTQLKVANIKVLPMIKDKTFFITNYDSNYISVMPSSMTNVQYTLKLDNIPNCVRAVDNKYLLVLTNGKTYVDVVDIKNEEIARQIDLGVEPTEIIISKDNKLAYIASNKASSIFEVDLINMSLTKQIKVKGNVEHLNLSEDNKKLIYQDSSTSDIYSLELDEKLSNIYQNNVANVSKLILKDNIIYALVRTKNELRMFDYQMVDSDTETSNKKNSLKESALSYLNGSSAIFKVGPLARKQKQREEELKEAEVHKYDWIIVPTSSKPVDMLFYNNTLYILSATDDVIDVYNLQEQKITAKIPLKLGGFSKQLSQLDNSNIAVVTNISSKKYSVVDLANLSTLQTVPIYAEINSVSILDRL